jgi:hypothetical protein
MPGDPGDAVLGRGILFSFRTASDLPSADGSGTLGNTAIVRDARPIRRT